ncbi:MAG: HD domain-containing phosphohydrolase, partial [Planctomycetota bacterium]
NLPDALGVEVLEKMLWQRALPIVMVTGENSVDVAIGAMGKGAFDYIVKAGDYLRTIPVVVSKSLERFRIQQENKRLQQEVLDASQKLKDLNLSLERKVEERTAELESLTRDLEKNYHESLRMLCALVEMRNRALGSHSKRVAAMAQAMMKHVGMPPEAVLNAEIAALLHDIGKLPMPDSVLGKMEEQLGPQERDLVQRHPALGQACLYPIERLRDVGKIIRAHHERFDGTGYPDRLKGEAIPFEARVIAVVNDFDRVAHAATQSTLGARGSAVAFVMQNKGLRYDANVVEVFLDWLKKLKADEKPSREEAVPVSKLKPDMVVGRDVFTQEGIMVLSCGTRLTQALIDQVKMYSTASPVGDVWVRS